jgi:zinc transport system permease protein
MTTNLNFLLIVGALVGAVSGLLGSLMILKRMSLVGDALSHVALPGMAIALMFKIDPMFGAFLTLFFAVLGIWYLEKTSDTYPEALVGLFFTISLAIGILITPEPELFEALFGSLEKISAVDGVIVVLSSALIFVVVRFIWQRLILDIVSPDLARVGGMKMARVNLWFLLMVGLAVALGVKFLGTLLTGALLIIPAIAARNISHNLSAYRWWSMGLGMSSAVVGILLGSWLTLPAGPLVVLVGGVFFLMTYLVRRYL